MTAYAIEISPWPELRFIVRGASAKPSRFDTVEEARTWIDAARMRNVAGARATLRDARVVTYPAPGTRHRVSGFDKAQVI